MTPAELAGRIDHTILKPEATWEQVHKITAEAVTHHFAAVCVSPCWIGRVAPMLAGTGVAACTVIGFPHGTSKTTVKAIESVSSIKDGAEEIDVVAHLPHLMAADLDAIKAELIEVARSARGTNSKVVIKVIVESALLMQLGDKAEKAIAIACQAVRESGCDFIKTSTGFHPAGGASVAAVALMKKYGQGIRIKAAGGIRDLATAKAMLEAGADRIGASASIALVQELAGR